MKKLLDFIKGLFVKIADVDGDGTVEFGDDVQPALEGLLPIARQAVETVLNVDLSGDGKITTKEEILLLAVRHGLPRLVKRVNSVVLDYADEGQLKQFLGIARIAAELAAHGLAVPRFRLLELLFTSAYALEADRD